jgi:hypothetical protein
MKLENKDRLNTSIAYLIQNGIKGSMLIWDNGTWTISSIDAIFFFNSDSYTGGETKEPKFILPLDGKAFIEEIYKTIERKLNSK